VRLEFDSRRGGILTQAGVLKVAANGTTISPVAGYETTRDQFQLAAISLPV